MIVLYIMHKAIKIEFEKNLEKIEINTNIKLIYFDKVAYFSVITTCYFCFSFA